MSTALSAALWLLPDDRGLQLAIDALCARHAAERFEAHLTLLGGVTLSDPDRAERELAALAAAAQPLELQVLGTGQSPALLQTAFLRCAESQALSGLRERAHAALGSGCAPAIGPHLSLIYATLPARTRGEIARAYESTFVPALRFSALALVQSSARGWEAIADWRVRCRHRLGA